MRPDDDPARAAELGQRAADRLTTLTDGVVAIALTLLALDLKPGVKSSASSRDLADYLGNHAGQYGSFVLAFALIAQYWVVHHRLMHAVRRASNALLRTTLLFLFGITLIPLTTFMQGSIGNSLSTSLFAANICLVSIAIALIGTQIHRDRLDDYAETDVERLARNVRAITSIVISASIAGLAWVLAVQASWLFLLFIVSNVPGWIVVRRRGRAPR